MEKKINTKTTHYLNTFKKNIIQKINNNTDEIDLINFIKKYEMLYFEKSDLQKRQRIKANIPYYNRCIAIRACGQQCTRRKKGDNSLCGTHLKGTPNGTIQKKESEQKKKIEITQQDINGIIYFMDNKGNIYSPDDIFQNNPNPNIISKYTITNEGKYIIQNSS